MRKIILQMSISLDGHIEAPGRRIDWHRVDEELHRHLNEELRGAGAFLSGRVTYELMAAYWPTADAGPDCPPVMADFAAIWRRMPKVVYSRTIDHADWNTTIRREVDPDEVRALQAEPGGDLVVGGADLAAAFLAHDLVDEYRLYVHPVAIGGGKPLFPADGVERPVRLLGTRTFGNGVVRLHYGRPDAA
ncbi:dihydrofolate reductase family protein [Kitasatospora paracochleata]|uniref:Dihydrofolate reductase n=1 Tax=Kitasatospora paracochleata TaxID=58354 RepID=A0ABT1J8M7_9ACTN|nr:dihydrofolate reductase family protein [Kitasatospora paracochleata]MCP2313791.1 dihydrofolate reductase [Kitasatospora paracochleata]